jgi:hypothetical protein
MEIETDIEAPEAVKEEFRRGFHVHAALAAARQARVNEACAAMESRLMDGVGQLRYRIDADLYWVARHKFGRHCWSDPAFLRDCEKKGLIKAVAGRSDRIAVNMGIRAPVKRRVNLVGNDRNDRNDLIDGGGR